MDFFPEQYPNRRPSEYYDTDNDLEDTQPLEVSDDPNKDMGDEFPKWANWLLTIVGNALGQIVRHAFFGTCWFVMLRAIGLREVSWLHGLIWSVFWDLLQIGYDFFEAHAQGARNREAERRIAQIVRDAAAHNEANKSFFDLDNVRVINKDKPDHITLEDLEYMRTHFNGKKTKLSWNGGIHPDIPGKEDGNGGLQ